MARSIDVLKANSVEALHLREQQELERAAAERQKRAALEAMASKVETETKSAVDQVAERTDAMNRHAASMAESADRVMSNSQDVAAAAEQALSNAQTVAAAVEQLTASIQEIAGQVSHGNTVSSKAVEKSEYTQRTISTLSDAITRIGEVVTLISEIAAQTNLLALNATIEAARAGEAGKGFAVVANEVKNLASQTAKATEEIGRQIDAIQSVSLTAVAAIKEIGRTIGEMDEISNAIATAVEEQGAATQRDRPQRRACGGSIPRGLFPHLRGLQGGRIDRRAARDRPGLRHRSRQLDRGTPGHPGSGRPHLHRRGGQAGAAAFRDRPALYPEDRRRHDGSDHRQPVGRRRPDRRCRR